MLRLSQAFVAALIALALGPLASAHAAPPALTISSPAPGSATSDATPLFAGATNDGLDPITVKVYNAEGELAAELTTTPVGGSWETRALTGLADGPYTVRAEQTSEERGVSEPVSFSVDTTPPAVTVTPIASPTDVKAPTFSGAAGAEAGDASTVEVKILRAHSVIQTYEVARSGGTWSVGPVSPLTPDGTYEVQVEQTDEAGNVGHAADVFSVDTTPPALTITSPKSHETLKSSSRPTFSGTTNNGPGEPTAVTIEVFDGESTSEEHLDQRFSVERSGSSWTSGSSGPRLSNGLYTVRVRELDTAGNVGESQPPVSFTVDTPSPTVTLDALPRWTSDATPTFAGAAATAEAKPEVKVKVWRGTSASGTVAETIATTESGGAWSAAASGALPDGTYTAQAEQGSEAGNPPGVSDTSTFTVDTVAPTVTLSAPSASAGIETVSGSAGTEPGDRRQVTVELFAGASVEAGSAIETITVNATGAAWSATFAGLASGEYTALARQADEAGNVGASAASTFAVSAPPASTLASASSAPSPPSASFTWVPANPTVGQSVSLLSSSTNGSSAIGSYAWDLAGSGQLGAGGAVMTTSFATPGAHVVRLQVTDVDGLASTSAQTITVTTAPPRLMQPFPIVRIAGAETSYGAKVSLLTVQAPVGATVQVSCVGRGCKTKSESRVALASSRTAAPSGAVSLTFKRFERSLRAGVTLQIKVTKAGEIGKFTSFAIRRDRLPVRSDACLQPASAKPSACPSS